MYTNIIFSKRVLFDSRKFESSAWRTLGFEHWQFRILYHPAAAAAEGTQAACGRQSYRAKPAQEDIKTHTRTEENDPQRNGNLTHAIPAFLFFLSSVMITRRCMHVYSVVAERSKEQCKALCTHAVLYEILYL